MHFHFRLSKIAYNVKPQHTNCVSVQQEKLCYLAGYLYSPIVVKLDGLDEEVFCEPKMTLSINPGCEMQK